MGFKGDICLFYYGKGAGNRCLKKETATVMDVSLKVCNYALYIFFLQTRLLLLPLDGDAHAMTLVFF
jgi:hypothetical protein